MTKRANDFDTVEFAKLVGSEPKRKGKLKLATPQEMKSVWRTAK
jgi:hypothetical protein